jgi:ubiquinone/menaquinone biosynthesis C-methylase UbiE
LSEILDKDVEVLEIGAGPGTLTIPLAKKVKKVVAVESSDLKRDSKMDKDYYQYIKGWFGKWASFYNFIALPLTGVRNKVADLVDEEDKVKILDVCTGTGTQAFAFAKRGYEVVGLDMSREMLKIAEKKNKYENVWFVMADAAKMPFEPDYFDFACISFGLHDMPHEVRHQVLDEMRRVSEKVIVVDYHIPKNRLHRWLHVSFTSLYESKYYRDFAKRNLEELLLEHGLRIVKEAYGLVDFVEILLCERFWK